MATIYRDATTKISAGKNRYAAAATHAGIYQSTQGKQSLDG